MEKNIINIEFDENKSYTLEELNSIRKQCHKISKSIMNDMDGGYIVDAIFGVWEQRKLDDDYTMYDEHIFVGECPHQDENGKWVTYNEVPNFIRHSFHSLYSCNADEPFIVRVMPEKKISRNTVKE